MEKYVLFMDKTGEIVKGDILPALPSPDLEEEISALVKQYGEIIQTLESVFGNLIKGFHRCNVMLEENKAQNKARLPEYDIYILAIKMNTDKVIDSIRSVKEMLMKHCCLVNALTDSVRETEQTPGKSFPGIEKIKESHQILQYYITKCDDYLGMLTVFHNELKLY